MYLAEDYQVILDYFAEQHLSYQLYRHEPMFTSDAAAKNRMGMPGAHTKNLFLKDKKKHYFLISILDHKRVNLNLLSRSLANGRFSFGASETLFDLLGVKPGSVTPYGLVNDKARQVTFLIDEDIYQFETVNFHPLRNDMTINIALDAFLGFCRGIEHEPRVIEIPLL